MKKIILLLSVAGFLLQALDIKDIYAKSYNYEKSYNYAEAIKVLIPLYEKYKHGYTINLRLGWLFFLNKRYKNAIKHYKKALLAAPKSMEAYLGLLRSYLMIGDIQNAIATGSVIVKIDYYNYYGNYYLLKALKRKKEYATAAAIANKMLQLYPTSILYLEALANITKIKEPQKAKEIYRNILILDPNNVAAKAALLTQTLQ